MATFFNQATLSYNGVTTTSNIVTGELVEALSVTKTAVTDTYSAGEKTTFVISMVNTGTAPLTDVTVTDDLGAVTVGNRTTVPLDFEAGSVRYYQNGILQPAPTVNAGPPLTFSGLTVPAGGNGMLIYETDTNRFAPGEANGQIVNTATVTGGGIADAVAASETITPEAEPLLSITKYMEPAAVTENDTLTYTFVIQNTGNTEADAADNAVISDTLTPVLDPITVTYNGTPWTEGVNYTYDTATGAFATLPGQITVPAAEFSQDPAGARIATPGTGTLVITGTV